jgi:hypothetical protein
LLAASRAAVADLADALLSYNNLYKKHRLHDADKF